MGWVGCVRPRRRRCTVVLLGAVLLWLTASRKPTPTLPQTPSRAQRPLHRGRVTPIKAAASPPLAQFLHGGDVKDSRYKQVVKSAAVRPPPTHTAAVDLKRSDRRSPSESIAGITTVHLPAEHQFQDSRMAKPAAATTRQPQVQSVHALQSSAAVGGVSVVPTCVDDWDRLHQPGFCKGQSRNGKSCVASEPALVGFRLGCACTCAKWDNAHRLKVSPWSKSSTFKPLAESQRAQRGGKRECGTWAGQYAAAHHKAFLDPVGSKFLVSSSNNRSGGLGDRYLGLCTGFLAALLTNRTFLINWPSHSLTSALVPPDRAESIQWFRTDVPKTQIDVRGFSHAFLSNLNNQAFDFERDYFRDVDVVNFWSDRGHAQLLFEHPKYGPQLRKMGLRVDNVFGCVFDFLFAPSPEVLSRLPNILDSRPSTDSARNATVAIHIRTGALEDAAGPLLAGANVPDNLRFDLAHYSAVFDCARQVSSALTKGANADVPWFLATDSKQLRQSASAHYGAQLQSASTHGAIGHVDPFEQHLHNNWLGEAQLQDSFVTAVVENYALSLTSAMIVTLGSFHKAMSGFAVTAHLRAPSPQRFVVVPGCREMSLDEVIRVQSDWSIV